LLDSLLQERLMVNLEVVGKSLNHIHYP